MSVKRTTLANMRLSKLGRKRTPSLGETASVDITGEGITVPDLVMIADAFVVGYLAPGMLLDVGLNAGNGAFWDHFLGLWPGRVLLRDGRNVKTEIPGRCLVKGRRRTIGIRAGLTGHCASLGSRSDG